MGIAFGIVFHLAILASINSFGVSYLEPYAPISSLKDINYFLKPIWQRENRRDFLKTKRPKKQENISMKWKDEK